MGAFELLTPPVQALIRERGFNYASLPQEVAIPHILAGENVLLMAPTGTGKTEAALLPLMDNLVREGLRGKGPYLLYITPLRSLNRDLLDRLGWWCKRLDLKLAVRHGDTPREERAGQSRAPPDILITTPETLQILLVGRRLRRQLTNVRWVVVDEVHELATDKRGAQLSLALERLRLILGREPQLIGLSATVGSPDVVASFLVGTRRKCRVLQAEEVKSFEFTVVYPRPTQRDHELASKVLFTYPDVAARVRHIHEILQRYQSALIFTNTRSEAEALGSRFRLLDINYPVAVHHSSLSRATRLAAESGLKEGRLKAVICTSSLEMGIDVGSVEVSIQYGSPRQVVRLIQRAGRSGHALGAVSRGLVVALDPEDLMESAVIARRARQGRLEATEVPEAPYEALAHQLAGLVIDRQRWHIEAIHQLITQAYPYRNVTLEELESIVTYMSERRPRLLSYDRRTGLVTKPPSLQPLYEYYFANLSMIPEERKYLVTLPDGEAIGVLDQEFVLEHARPGAKFVEAGQIWRITSVGEGVIQVVPDEDPLGAIPTWVGDEIPVPYEVAREVGWVRFNIAARLQGGESLEQVALAITDEYPLKGDAALEVARPVQQHLHLHYPVPSPDRLVVEGDGNQVIIHACYGTLANSLLARATGYLLSKIVGAPVQVEFDPYRFTLAGPGVTPGLAVDALKALASMDLRATARAAFEDSGVFRKRFVQVAQKFGVFERGIPMDPGLLKTAIEAVRGTPVYEETIKTVLQQDADLKTCEAILRRLAAGEIDVVLVREGLPISPLAKLGIERMAMKTDIVKGERLRALLINAVRSRLLSEGRVFVCTACWNFVSPMRVLDYWNRPTCPDCGSRRIGMASEPLDLVEGIARRVRLALPLNLRQRGVKARLERSGGLLERYGVAAALTLAAKGMTTKMASKILEEVGELGDTLILRIIRAERALLKRVIGRMG